ncbi:MFS transporter [Solwaraspora sp. WMMD406]|uniref:MFS transporter n=1 Tax=Solwaraspora sp. WMMD406 TaxID=3016095 RepID=UPI002415ADA6|nr:MFS transporter [Solwaraspora sp. WMMD406]MDG4763992.1 MFS transporter [Solwaraspora sp. WMMD406]
MRTALRSRPIRTFLIVQFLLDVQFWFPIWLIYLLDLGFSLTTAVLADAVFRLVTVVCEFPVGVVADRVGRRRTYLTLAAMAVLTFTVITQIETVSTLFTAWVLWGVLWALASGASAPYLYELCAQDPLPVDPGKAFGLVRAAGHVSVFVSLLTAGYLYEADPRAPFAVTAALAAVALGLVLTLPEIHARPAPARLAAIAADLRAALTHPAVRRAVWIGVLLLVFGWSVRILFQPLALDLQLSARATGWMYAAFAAASVLGGLTAGHLGRRHRRAALATAFLLILASAAATSQLPALGPFVLLPVMAFGYVLGTTVLEVLTNEVSPAGTRAAMLGLVASVGGVAIAVARPGLGILSEDHPAALGFGIWALIGIPLVGLALYAIRRGEP